MKRIALLLTLLASVSLLVLSQSGCEPAATNRAVPANSDTNTNSARETVDKAAIEAEIKRIENDFPRVVREKDVEAIRRVEADDAILIYPDGSVGNKEQDIKDMEAGALSADSWEVTDLRVNVLDADAAVASGRAIVKGGKMKLPDGKTVDISGQYRFIDTFARREGQWKLVAAAAVPVRQPPAEGASSPASSPRVSPSPASSPRVPSRPSPAASPKTSP